MDEHLSDQAAGMRRCHDYTTALQDAVTADDSFWKYDQLP